MTTDERIDRLVERHEALAQSVELLAASVHEQGLNIDKLLECIGATLITSSEQGQSIAMLLASSAKTDARIEALVSIAESHSRRLSDLEGGAR